MKANSPLHKGFFWVNFCLAVFFTGMLVIMGVVILLYATVLNMENTTVSEFHGILIFTALLAGFISLLATTAWGLRQLKKWWLAPQLGAIAMAASGVIYLTTIV